MNNYAVLGLMHKALSSKTVNEGLGVEGISIIGATWTLQAIKQNN